MSRLDDIKKAIETAPKVPLGELIEQISIKAGYKVSDIAGVDINKSFIVSHANLSESDTSKYKVVKQWNFACNLMHIGRDIKIPVAINTSDINLYVSPAYYVFRVKNNVEILPLYLYIELNRYEFDRLTWFYSDSSVRGNLKEERFLDIRIPLPPIDVQKKYVDAYDGLQQLIRQNEALLKPLSDACQAYMAEVKSKYAEVTLGELIEPITTQVNKDGYDYPFMGVNINKEIVPTSANISNVNPKKYIYIKHYQFVFSGMQTGRDKCIRFAIHTGTSPVLLSPAYTILQVKDQAKVLPEFIFAQFLSSEKDRLGWFYSDGSVRANLDLPRFLDIRIPLPPIDVQKSIVALHKCAEEARDIAAEARETLRKMCPAMVQRASHHI